MTGQQIPNGNSYFQNPVVMKFPLLNWTAKKKAPHIWEVLAKNFQFKKTNKHQAFAICHTKPADMLIRIHACTHFSIFAISKQYPHFEGEKLHTKATLI